MKVTLILVLLALTLNEDISLDQQFLITEVNKIQNNWVAGHNNYFDGRTMEDIKNLMRVLRTPEKLKLPLKDIKPLKNIPTQFFSSTQWPKCSSIREIRDQSTCSASWAFGTAQVMSDRICIASNQTLQIRISSQDLLTCCGILCGGGCGGGYPSSAWSYAKKSGIVTGGLYNDTLNCQPYHFAPCDHHTTGKYQPCGANQPTPRCQQTCINGAVYMADKWFVESIYAVPSNIEKIQTQIMTNGPVVGEIYVYSDLLTYKSGVYHHVSGKSLGGRAIKIVGWGVENEVPYWLVANSWNEDWGDNGFFKIRRGKDDCGIQGGITAGIPYLKSTLSEQ